MESTERHPGRDVKPEERRELSQSIDGFADLAVVRVETVLYSDEADLERELDACYETRSVSSQANMASGELLDVRTFTSPRDDEVLDVFDKVVTYVRKENRFFLDVISVAVVNGGTRREVERGGGVSELQQVFDEFLQLDSSINLRYSESHAGLEGLPVTSVIVAVPDQLPRIKTRDGTIEKDLIERFTSENEQLLRTINFVDGSPASAIVPESEPEFLISHQEISATFGPYAAILFHPKNQIHGFGSSRPEYGYVDALRTLVPLFRKLNWLQHRKEFISEAEERILQINNRLDDFESPRSLTRPVGDVQQIGLYEDLLEEVRVDAIAATQAQQELESLGNPYREKTSLASDIQETFSISENSPFLQMLPDGVYANLTQYCAMEEPFVRKELNRLIDRHKIAQESLFAEVSASSTRENMRLQLLILVLTAILVILTGVLVAPVLL